MCGRGEEGACLGSGHLRWYRESCTVVAAEAEHPGHSVTPAQELEGLIKEVMLKMSRKTINMQIIQNYCSHVHYNNSSKAIL